MSNPLLLLLLPKDAKFNSNAMSRKGRIVNVYDRGDYLIQQEFGNIDGGKLKVLLSSPFKQNAKQPMSGAINIAIGKPDSYPNFPNTSIPSFSVESIGFWFLRQYEKHTTIQDAKNWNQFVDPLFRR